MSSEIEAAGAAITAGIVAKTLDGKDGPAVVHGPCANCGAQVDGRFCAACGQPGHVHRTLGHFIEEAVHGVLHFDTRAWRTLPMLVGRPGTLTRRYTLGERARFISPVALFLFTVFLMFFVFALMGEQAAPIGGRPTIAELQDDAADAASDIREAETELADLRRQKAEIDAKPRREPGEGAGLGGKIAGAEAALAGARLQLETARRRLADIETRTADLTRARDQLKLNLEQEKAGGDTAGIQSIEFALTRIEEALADPAGPIDGITATIGPDGGVSTSFSGVGASEETIFQQIREMNARGEINLNFPIESWNEKIHHKLENPELAWYKIQNTAYKFSFLLIPISLPLIWLMFSWKRGTTLFDHSVFALYSLSFMSLLFIVMIVLGRSWPWSVDYILPVLPLAIPVHMFFQLKGGYALGVFSALWRTVYLLFASLFSLLVFLFAILMLGLLG